MLPPVVSRADLAALDDAVLVDVRRALPGCSPEQAYAAGHLPGAVLVDLERWLAGPARPADGRHPLPAPEVFAEGMARAGVSAGNVVVAYDDNDGVVAARLGRSG